MPEPHPVAVAHLDAMKAAGWDVLVADRGDYWAVALSKDDVHQTTTAFSRQIAVEQAAWHNGARWD